MLPTLVMPVSHLNGVRAGLRGGINCMVLVAGGR